MSRLLILILIWVGGASGASASEVSLGFGGHSIETVRIFSRKIHGKPTWLGSYLSRGRRLRERVLPVEVSKDLREKLDRIIRENRADLPVWTPACATRIVYTKETKTQIFCGDRASILAQKRVAEWIREAQQVLGIKP